MQTATIETMYRVVNFCFCNDIKTCDNAHALISLLQDRVAFGIRIYRLRQFIPVLLVELGSRAIKRTGMKIGSLEFRKVAVATKLLEVHKTMYEQMVVSIETICSDAKENEKRTIQVYLGKVALSCAEVLAAIADGMRSCRDLDKDALDAGIEFWRKILGKEMASNSQVLMLVPKEGACIISSDLAISSQIDRTMKKLEKLVSEGTRTAGKGNSTELQLQSYLRVCGILLTQIAAIRVATYMDHPSLIPSKEWHKTVKKSREDQQRVLDEAKGNS